MDTTKQCRMPSTIPILRAADLTHWWSQRGGRMRSLYSWQAHIFLRRPDMRRAYDLFTAALAQQIKQTAGRPMGRVEFSYDFPRGAVAATWNAAAEGIGYRREGNHFVPTN